mmetsp:Transcript_31530/g.51217  ORF Transcript_31530/g.51217 Transcript_31530/m.51217 type:complete len:268 (+) Transcript_31530:362-1165(+)
MRRIFSSLMRHPRSFLSSPPLVRPERMLPRMHLSLPVRHDGFPEKIDGTKVDAKLGWKVREHLIKLGLETPTVENGLASEEQIGKVTEHFTGIMDTLGLDLTNDSLRDSPKRVARMFINEMFWGLNPDYFPRCTAVDNQMSYDSMVIEKDISLSSYCEHHFVLIDGSAHVAYIPGAKVVGLSKLNRVVQYFSRRPQIQERLTEQIWAALSLILETEDVAVMINAVHHCVKTRGIQDHASSTVTTKLGGDFKNDQRTRAEFMNIVTQK